MKKILLALIAALGISASAAAQIETATPVTFIVRSTSTFAPVTIASHTATTVVDNSTQLYRYVVVENEEASANIFCSERSATGITGAGRGAKIKAQKWKSFTLKYDASLYCRCDQTGATCAGFAYKWK